MPDWDSLLNPKLPYFVLGVIFLLGAVVSMCTGATISRTTGLIYRAEDPRGFWSGVIIYSLAGMLFIAFYLHAVFPEIAFYLER